jgi:hypothetical protein
VLPEAFGEQDVPTLGEPGPANINLFGTSDFTRTMQRAGGAKAKAAVDAALHWLAVPQESDGLAIQSPQGNSGVRGRPAAGPSGRQRGFRDWRSRSALDGIIPRRQGPADEVPVPQGTEAGETRQPPSPGWVLPGGLPSNLRVSWGV